MHINQRTSKQTAYHHAFVRCRVRVIRCAYPQFFDVDIHKAICISDLREIFIHTCLEHPEKRRRTQDAEEHLCTSRTHPRWLTHLASDNYEVPRNGWRTSKTTETMLGPVPDGPKYRSADSQVSIRGKFV